MTVKAELKAVRGAASGKQAATKQQSVRSSSRSQAMSDDEDEALLRPKQQTAAAAASQTNSPTANNGDEEQDAGDSDDELKVNIVERPAHTLPPTRNTAPRHPAADTDSSDEDEESDEEEEQASLSINKEFAAQYEADKRQQELSKKAQRGKKKSDMIALVQQEMSGRGDDEEADDDEEGEEDEDEDEDEDDEGALLTEELDVRIHETLNAIKRRDPRVYDKSTVFFADEDGEAGEGRGDKADGGASSKRKVTVKQLLMESMNGEDNEDEEDDGAGDDDNMVRPLTHVQEQAKLKRDLLDAANAAEGKTTHQQADDEEGDDDDDLFKVRINTAAPSSSSSSEPPTAPLSSTAFLTSYLSHQWWKADPSTLPSWTTLRGNDQPNPTTIPTLSDDDDDDEEERFEAFEAAYNFRHMEEGGSEVKTWPRTIEDSVRRKDNTRKLARERKKEAAEAERKRREEELKRMKNDKLKTIQLKMKQVEEVSGVILDDDVKQGLRLDKGWDEDEHERLMAQLFDTEYYDKGMTVDENEEAAIERLRRAEEEEDAKTTNGNKAAGGRGRLLSTVHPKLRQELLKDMDELYALDYEDVIGGGEVKTRFHYTKVKPDTYGLTLDDILVKEDKELNKTISIKKLAPYRAENEPIEEERERRTRRRKRRRGRRLQE